jgi:hypothetical protein
LDPVYIMLLTEYYKNCQRQEFILVLSEYILVDLLIDLLVFLAYISDSIVVSEKANLQNLCMGIFG